MEYLEVGSEDEFWERNVENGRLEISFWCIDWDVK